MPFNNRKLNSVQLYSKEERVHIKVHIQNQLSVYLYYSKETEMQYLRYIIVLQ